MNLFVVETPHQLLNAIEARARFKASRNVILVACLQSYSYDSYREILEEHPWDKVYRMETLQRRTKSTGQGFFQVIIRRCVSYCDEYHKRKKVDSLAQEIAGVNQLFLGNYNSNYMKHLAHRLRSEELLLLDDGTATLLICERRRLRERLHEPQGRTAAATLIKEWLFGFDNAELKQVTFFSTYDLNVAEGDRHVKNDYSYLRSLAAGVDAQECVYFVGQPLVEDSLISMERLLARFERVRAHFAGERFIYLPHKRERADKVRDLQERFQFEVKSFDVPIEYQMSVRGTRPKVLASFFSSALENSRVIFGPLVRIKSFRVDPEDFLGRREEIASIYAYYAGKQSEHFEVIG